MISASGGDSYGGEVIWLVVSVMMLYKRYWRVMRRGGGPTIQWPPPWAHYGDNTLLFHLYSQHFATMLSLIIEDTLLHIYTIKRTLPYTYPEQLYCEFESLGVHVGKGTHG